MTYRIGGDKIIVDGGDGKVRYKIGYKQRGQWRYIIIEGKIEAILNMVDKLFFLGYTQMSIKILESEV